MCRQVIVDGEWCGTNGELKAQIGGDPIYQKGVDDISDDDCLCCIDIPATVQHYSLIVEEDSGWETILRKPSLSI